MNTHHEGSGLKEPLDSASMEITPLEDGNGNFLLFSVNDECQMRLTIEEARLLAIRIIMAANRAEIRGNLKRSNMNLSRTTEAATEAGWFRQAFAK